VIAPPNLSLLLIMACFWVVYLLVRTQFLKPLGMLLDQREKQVREAREGHASAQQMLQEAIARCERELAQTASDAQKQRASLRAAGEAVRRQRIEAARTQGQERLAAVAEELEQAVQQAREVIRTRARELSRSLAERLLGRRVAA
jgi:F0F1-type ATP synthase membrane subunit b/b'